MGVQPERVGRGRTGEWRGAGEHRAQYGAQSEHVRPAVGRLPPRLLRGHVPWGAEYDPGPGAIAVAGHRRARVGRPERERLRVVGRSRDREVRRSVSGFVGRRGQVFGQSPVHHLHFAERPDHHVGGLQIPVQDIATVGEGDRLAHHLEHGHEPPAVVTRVGAGGQQFVQSAALDELHGQIRPAVG